MNVYGVTNAMGSTLTKTEIDDILKDLGISEEAIKDGSSSAIEKDAETNKIDLTQLTYLAKEQGASELNGADPKEDFEKELTSLGVPTDVIFQGKSAVEAYAATNGIQLPTPPAGASFRYVA